MGNLILCHSKKADQPYEITRIRKRIYTMEELCYYLCKNLYLVDYTIINNKLCDWLEEELEVGELAKTLQALIEEENATEQFVLHILEHSKIYTESELMHIQNVLEKLKTQRDVERQKYKADNLLESGEFASAILVYKAILREDKDETIEEKFYGMIYANLGAAYGRSLLYEEAAKMYEKAYEILRDNDMVVGYLYACSQYMPTKEYKELLEKSNMLVATDNSLAEKKAKGILDNASKFHSQTLLEWKRQYRES
jgi:hypothetical protein